MKTLLFNYITVHPFLKEGNLLKMKTQTTMKLHRLLGTHLKLPVHSKQPRAVARSLLLLIKPSSTIGGTAHNDKQLPCYKGGRKSIKLNNKTAIEFLWLFIAAAYILV